MTEKLVAAGKVTQSIYGWLKKISLQICGGLFMEQKDDTGMWIVSMGKTAFWITFGHCLYVWNTTQEVIVEGANKIVRGDVWNTTQEVIVEGANKIVRGDVSDGELYALFTLVGYQGAKLAKSTITEALATWKGTPNG